MSNELVQTGFFDLGPASNESDEITIDATWASLPDEEFDQAATTFHEQLDQQENVLKMMTSEVIRRKGELYIAYKAKQGHGNFINWLGRIGVSQTTAKDHMQIVRELGNTLLNRRRVGDLGFRQWIGIARSPERDQIVTKIEAGVIEPTPKAVNAEIEAAKQREMEAKRAAVDAVKAKRKAEEEAATAQQQLGIFQSHSQLAQSKIDELNKQITDLVKQIKTIETPERVEVIPQETKEKIASLEAQVKTIAEQKGMLYQETEKLTAELRKQRDANESRRKQEQYEFEIKSGWKKATEALYKALSQFIGQIPSPIATQVFEGDEWGRYDQIEQALKHFYEAFAGIKTTKYSNQFVESAVVVSPTIVEEYSNGTSR